MEVSQFPHSRVGHIVYNPMEHLHQSNFVYLPKQGNIYTMTRLELANGTKKLLVATLQRDIYCIEYVENREGKLSVSAREVPFTYIPCKNNDGQTQFPL